MWRTLVSRRDIAGSLAITISYFLYYAIDEKAVVYLTVLNPSFPSCASDVALIVLVYFLWYEIR